MRRHIEREGWAFSNATKYEKIVLTILVQRSQLHLPNVQLLSLDHTHKHTRKHIHTHTRKRIEKFHKITRKYARINYAIRRVPPRPATTYELIRNVAKIYELHRIRRSLRFIIFPILSSHLKVMVSVSFDLRTWMVRTRCIWWVIVINIRSKYILILRIISK